MKQLADTEKQITFPIWIFLHFFRNQRSRFAFPTKENHCPMSEKFKQIIVASLGKETRGCMGQFEWLVFSFSLLCNSSGNFSLFCYTSMRQAMANKPSQLSHSSVFENCPWLRSRRKWNTFGYSGISMPIIIICNLPEHSQWIDGSGHAYWACYLLPIRR